MLYASLPVRFPIRFGENATAGYIRAIPTAAATPTPTDAPASLQQGFPPDTFLPISGGGIPPSGADVNGILYRLSAWAQWQAAGGASIYDATFSTDIGGYPKYSLLSSTTVGVLWQSGIDNNTNDPDVTPTGWVRVGATEASVAEIQGGSVTGKYISPGNLATAMGSAASESCLLPNGRILKAGTISQTMTVPNLYTVSFGAGFPTGITAVTGLTMTKFTPESSKMPVVYLNAWGQFGFSFYVGGTETGSPKAIAGVHWAAEGY